MFVGISPLPPVTLLVRMNGPAKFLLVKIGPQKIGEVNFGIGHLPEQEIADPHLSARTDQKIGIGPGRGV